MRTFSRHYNIITSCDETLLPYLPVQLASICSSLPDALTDVYLFHRGIREARLRSLYAFCHAVGNLRFHSVPVREAEKYDAIAAHGVSWAGEAYYSLCAGAYLPAAEDRALYIDAGDVLVEGDIAPYYYAPFDGNVLTVHCSKAEAVDETDAVDAAFMADKADTVNAADAVDMAFTADKADGERRVRFLTAKDLKTRYAEICHTPCLFNSGSYVINLAQQRADGKTMDDFVRFAEELCALSGDAENAWWGDQGFLSALYAGRLHYFGFREHPTVWYQPYNFVLSYHFYNQDGPDYEPAVIHYAGGGVPKPWNVTGNPNPVRYPGTDGPLPPPPLEDLYRIWQVTAQAADQILKKLGC